MNTYTVSQIKAPQFASSKPIETYPEESKKRIAVLFTDIVGSSHFFKSHGDAAGRKMLKQHQEMASPVVDEHGGIVVKVLGDSIMAYFSNPQEALKSAIKIQQKFQRFNQRKETHYQIQIRMCIHYGVGIVEDKDIFGDVVNMAAKFLPLADAGQVLISHEIFKQVQSLSRLRFETVDLPSNKNLLKGMIIYRVIWDSTISFDPYVKTLLYFKPVWELGENGFAKAWNSLLDNKNSIWVSKVEKELIPSDKSLALIVKDPGSSLSLAKDVIKFLSSKLEKSSPLFLPLQIIIDSGTYVRAGELFLESLTVDWKEIEPGDIYISYAIYETLGEKEGLSVHPTPDKNHPQSFYKVNPDAQHLSRPGLFLYKNALVRGKYPPCFYCGDRKHLAASCPSKRFLKATQVMKDLGYLPLEEINQLFFNYITDTDIIAGNGIESLNAPDQVTQWAYHGFYELKMVYQLRFLNLLWSTKEEDWRYIKESKSDTSKGGMIWLGLDCLRVSKLDQAEKMLLSALEKHPHDYRANCVMGFLNVDGNNFLQAEHYFSKAFDYAETKPQRIFTLFLLSRLCYLNNALDKAANHISKIRYMEPDCPEAVYQDIIFRFRNQKAAEALHELVKLIKRNREYYAYALIDPELADFSDLIHPELNNLLNDAFETAREIREEAEPKSIELEKQLTDEEKEINDPKAMMLKIAELEKVDSYFNDLDIIYYGSSIIHIASDYLENRKMKFLRTLNKLRLRVKRCIISANRLTRRNLVSAISRKLKKIQATMDEYELMARNNDPEWLKDALVQNNKLDQELKQIESELKKHHKTQQLLFFITKFFKSVLLLQSVNVLISFFLFPICTYYLHFILPGVEITPDIIWEWQKIVMIIGGFSGLCLALMLSTKSLPVE